MRLNEIIIKYNSGKIEKYKDGYLLIPYKANNKIEILSKFTYNKFSDIYQIITAFKGILKSIKRDIKKGTFSKSSEDEIISIEIIDALNNKHKYDKAVFFTGEFDADNKLKDLWYIKTAISKEELKSVLSSVEDFRVELLLKLNYAILKQFK